MSFSLPNFFLFSIALISGIAMLSEGCLILLLKKQITPLPTRILFGLSTLSAGRQRGKRMFAGRTSPKDLRAYAACVLVFGPIILISSVVYLFTAVL